MAFICTHVLFGAHPACAKDGKEERKGMWEAPRDGMKGGNTANGALSHRKAT